MPVEIPSHLSLFAGVQQIPVNNTKNPYSVAKSNLKVLAHAHGVSPLKYAEALYVSAWKLVTGCPKHYLDQPIDRIGQEFIFRNALARMLGIAQIDWDPQQEEESKDVPNT